MAKQKNKGQDVKIKKLSVTPVNEESVKLDMSFEDAVKLALNTKIKSSKIKK